MITSGSLDRQIEIQRSIESADSMGQMVKTWRRHKIVWANVTPVSGNEAFRASREVAVKTAKFTLRYFSDLEAKDRIKYADEYWDILVRA